MLNKATSMPPIYSHLLSTFYGRLLQGSEKKEAITLSYLFLLRALLELSSHTKKIERVGRSTKIRHHISSYLERCTEMLLSPSESTLGSSAGLINRIFFYLEILIQNQEIPSSSETHTNTIFQKIKKRLEEEKLQLFIEQPQEPPPERVVALSTFLKEQLLQLVPIIIDSVKDHLDDENILYLLIKFRKRLDDLVDKKTIEQLLSIAFPGGIHELKRFIMRKYKERGFSEIFMEDEELISS